MSQPLVSVIIPTYNRSGLLKEGLNSLLEQTMVDWECLIIDDGSTSAELNSILYQIEGKRQFHLYKRPKELPKGPSACRNFGLKIAKGKYIQFFDDDDIMYPYMLEKKIEIIERESVDVVVSPLDYYSVRDKKVLKQNKIFSTNLIKDYVMGEITWFSSGPLWRKDFLAVRFDESIQTLDDYDFNLRNIYNGPKISYIKEPLQRYNRYDHGKTLSSKAQIGDEVQIESCFKGYRKQYLLLKEMNLLTPEIKGWFTHLLIYYLRAALALSYSTSNKILFFLLRNFFISQTILLIKVSIGYISFKTTGKGYRLLSNKKL